MATKKASTDGVRLTFANGATVVVSPDKQARLEQMGFTAAKSTKASSSSGDTSK